MSDWTSAKNNSDASDNAAEEIYQDYKKSITLPLKKPARQFVLCPVGLVGSGKSTVVKALAQKLFLVPISSDELRRRLKERGFKYDRAKELAMRMGCEFIEGGYSVAFDMNCGSPGSKKDIVQIEKKYGIPVVWIHVNPPEEFIVQKLKNYPHSWLFRDGEDAVEGYFKYKEKHGDFGSIDFICSIDTSLDDLPKQIENAAKIIYEKYF